MPAPAAALPRRSFRGLTIRARLTLLYGLVSAIIGIVPVGLVCVLIEHDLGSSVAIAVAESSQPVVLTPLSPTAKLERPVSGRTHPTNQKLPYPALVVVCAQSTRSQSCGSSDGVTLARAATITELGQGLSARLVNQMVLYALLAFGVLVSLAFGLGWWLAGRALRPVHRMAAATSRLSSTNLHERIPLHRPKDELRALGESFNALLDRLAAAFAGQQRFVANVAHELRTPLTIQRATIQIGLGDLSIDQGELAAVRDELLTANRRHETLIDRLLLLARGDAGLDHREPLDLATVANDAIAPLLGAAEDQDITLTARTDPLPIDGDPVLLTALVTNLVQNAVRHNHPHGHVDVRTSADGLVVRNTGPEIAEDAVESLFEPFRRLHTDRTGSASGTGLGLSIARSIVTAHGGGITARPNASGGGLSVRVTFPS